MSNQAHYKIAGWLVALLLLITVSPVQAQGGQGVFPTVRDLEGALENLQIVIRGTVQNPLPAAIAGVEVEIGFRAPDGAETTRTVRVERINAGASAAFEFRAESGISPLSRFGAYVSRFTFETRDIDELAMLYTANANGNVLNALIYTFRQFEESALPDLRACIAPDPSTPGDNRATIIDMLCVEGLVSLRSGEAVPDLLALGLWYDTQLAGPAELFAMTADSDDSVINTFSYLAPHRDQAALVSNVDVMGFAIQAQGSSAIPDLLRATQHPDSQIQRTARYLLRAPGILNTETLLAEPHSATLQAILLAVGDAGYVEALPVLLDLRAARPDLRETLDASVAALGAEALPGLIEGLGANRTATAEQAAALLHPLAASHTAALRDLLPNDIVPASDSADDLIAALREHADVQIAAQAGERFAASLAHYNDGDCATALVLLEEGLSTRDDVTPPPEGAAILSCAARQQADQGVYAEAVALGLRAEALAPEDLTLRADVTGWLLAQTERSFELGLNNQAADLGKDVLARDPAQRDLRLRLAGLVLNSNVEYAAIGLLALGFAIALGLLYKVEKW